MDKDSFRWMLFFLQTESKKELWICEQQKVQM